MGSGWLVGRRPEVFVRQVSMPEGQRLQRITRTARDPVQLRRASVALLSAQAQPAPHIAHLLKTSEDYVRNVIHAFNEQGCDRSGCVSPWLSLRLVGAVGCPRRMRRVLPVGRWSRWT